MDAVKSFRWVVEIEVSESAVAGGLDFRNNMLDFALLRAFPYVSGNDLQVRKIKAPSPESIAIAQGAYKRLGWVRPGFGRWHLEIEVNGKTQHLCGVKPIPHTHSLKLDPSASPESKRKCPECARRDE